MAFLIINSAYGYKKNVSNMEIYMKKNLCAGIIFNPFVSTCRYASTPESECAVEEAAQDVLHAVTRLGYSAFLFPLREPLSRLFVWLERTKPDVLINLCEGYQGNPQLEAQIAAILELEGLAFTGNTSKALALCQDKYKTKIILSALGYNTPRFALSKSAQDEIDLAFPVIVKPNFEDASLGVNVNSVAHDQKELKRNIRKVLENYGQPALVEEYIEGREFNVAVFDFSEPVYLQVSEIDFSEWPADTPHICSYEAKWIEEHLHFRHTIPKCPAEISTPLRDKLQQTAIDVFTDLDCRDYARVDYRVYADGTPFILEVNPNPDISLNAGYARALIATGIEYDSFWDLMIRKALRRIENNDQIHAKLGQEHTH
jgi:D-alanine-D-alanine ligase